MVRSLRQAAAALALALALSLCATVLHAQVGDARPPGRAHPSSAAPLGGVNVPGLSRDSTATEADHAIALARRLHARVVRAGIPWSVMEPRGPGLINPAAQAFVDRLVEDAAAAGMRVIPFADSTPCWASSAPVAVLHGCSTTQSGEANAWPPRNPADYAAFVAYLAQRYGSRLAAIEIWNEPDQANEDYFAGPNKARRYAVLLRAAYPAIKRANARLPVLAGSFVGSNGIFLRDLYAAGIKHYYDGLAVHFYTLTLAALRSTHEVQLENGDSTPLWLDEFGWPSCWPQHGIEQEQACVTRQVQAANLANTFRALAHTSYVAAEVVYKLQDSGLEDFGMFSANEASKPAFTALSRVLSSPFGKPDPVTLSLRRQGGRVVASGSAPVGDFVQLEAFRGGSLRYRALFTLNRFNGYSIALPRVLGRHGLRVRVYQYWAGLTRDAQKSI